jgi:hypothetical protein
MTSALLQGPYGFKPLRHAFGGLVRPNAFGFYSIASAYGTNLFSGDLVATTGACQSIAGVTAKNIALAAVGTAKARGVFMGCEFVDSVGNVRFEKAYTQIAPLANTLIKAFVYDDPFIVYKAQATTGFASGNVSAFFKQNTGTAGSTLTGMSGQAVDTSTHNATSTNLNLFVLGLTEIPGNDFGGFAEVEVMISAHELNPFTATGS